MKIIDSSLCRSIFNRSRWFLDLLHFTCRYRRYRFLFQVYCNYFNTWLVYYLLLYFLRFIEYAICLSDLDTGRLLKKVIVLFLGKLLDWDFDVKVACYWIPLELWSVQHFLWKGRATQSWAIHVTRLLPCFESNAYIDLESSSVLNGLSASLF